MVDYYGALELSQTATLQEVKQAYRRLALKWHPDKNLDKKEEAEKKFKEINEAYEVLSDEKKRKIYDQYGKEGLEGGAKRMRRHYRDMDHDFAPFFQFSFRNPEDVFREFFDCNPFADLSGSVFFGGLNQNGTGSLRTMPTHRFGFGNLPYLINDMQADFPGFPGFPSGFHSGFTNAVSTAGGGGSAPSVGVRKTSTSTRFVNGKKIETKKVSANGVETVTVHEDGVLKSRTVNGVPQQLSAIRQ